MTVSGFCLDEEGCHAGGMAAAASGLVCGLDGLHIRPQVLPDVAEEKSWLNKGDAVKEEEAHRPRERGDFVVMDSTNMLALARCFMLRHERTLKSTNLRYVLKRMLSTGLFVFAGEN